MGRSVYGGSNFRWDWQSTIPITARFLGFPDWTEGDATDPENALLEIPGKDGGPPMDLVVPLRAVLFKKLREIPLGARITIIHQGLRTGRSGANFRDFQIWNHDFTPDLSLPPGLAGPTEDSETFEEWLAKAQEEAE